MILLGILLILLSLLFEHFAVRDLSQGAIVGDGYMNTVRILRGVGIGFCALGVLFWCFVIGTAVVAAMG